MNTSPAFPSGACDTHIHFYDAEYPTDPHALLRPPDAETAEYDAFQRELGLARAVVVQPTTYGLDNRCQLDAMQALGTDVRGVVVVDQHVTDHDLERLTARGVRGARFHMLPGGAVGWEAMATVAARIHDFGWHIQLQLNGRELTDRSDLLRALPGTLVVDHVGRFTPPVPVGDPSFASLRALVDQGRCWVKLSAPYESSVSGPPDYADVGVLARALVDHAPERMLWASNWPHPGQPAPPSGAELAALLASWAGDDATMHRILVDNPAELYGF